MNFLEEDLHQEFQGFGQGAKKTFTKGSKALAKEAWTEGPYQGIKEALGQGAVRPSSRD